MKTASVAFYRGSGFPAWLVRHWTRSPFGHCALLIGTTVYEAVAGGVSRRPATNHERHAVVAPCPWVDAEAVGAFCVSKLGCPYDWGAVLMSGLGQRLPGGYHLLDTRQASFDCSRLVSLALGLTDYAQPCPPTPGWVYGAVLRRGNDWGHE